MKADQKAAATAGSTDRLKAVPTDAQTAARWAESWGQQMAAQKAAMTDSRLAEQLADSSAAEMEHTKAVRWAHCWVG